MEITSLFTAILVTFHISNSGEITRTNEVQYSSITQCEEVLFERSVKETNPNIEYVCEWN